MFAGRWAATILWVGGAIIFVAYKYHYAAEKYKPACQSDVAAIPFLGPQTPSSANECADPKKYLPWWYELIAWPEGIQNWAIVATGLLIAWQSYETRKSAQAARDSIDLSRDTAKRQLRAYMCIGKVRLNVTPDKQLKAQIHIENSGQSPAYEVRTWALPVIREHPLNAPLDPPKVDALKGVSVIGPKGEQIMVTKPLKVIQWGPLHTAHHAIYVHGECAYRDIFGDGYILKFRLIVGGPAGVNFKKDSEGNMFATMCMDTEGNEEIKQTHNRDQRPKPN